MKLNVIKLDGGKAGSIDLDDALFGLDPRADILHRVVRWQRNNAQAGTRLKQDQKLTILQRKYIAKKVLAGRVMVLGQHQFFAVVGFIKARPHEATDMNYPRR